MDKIIARLNIEHFRKRLTDATDEAERETLRRLLADEEAKLKAIIEREERGKPGD
ncbi:MAG: hypothetical protein BroJett030_12150 [Alphaproteobacteria bacterium]|nr:MAG: hypothetical protein BroJett030_12150 [Alphaproteobacteria bacterium]